MKTDKWFWKEERGNIWPVAGAKVEFGMGIEEFGSAVRLLKSAKQFSRLKNRLNIIANCKYQIEN